jgi:hypothetical protein
MRLLIDTDAFCKLGIGGVLREAVELLGAELQEAGRLPALPHMLRRGRLRKVFGPDACDILIPVAETLPVAAQAAETWLERLTAIDAIDPGEAQIFAIAAEKGLIVVSGDKRALGALGEVPGFADALAGRIVVVEALLLALCDRLGPEEVRKRVQALMAADKVVRVCFSAGNSDPQGALLSYYRSIADECKPLVLWNPRAGSGP